MSSGDQKQPYIGAPVSLISSLDVRYEGILFTIDPNESTVALQNVKCMGTEDRQPPGDKAIPKSDTVYEFIIFRGENIKSICLAEHQKDSHDKSPINDPSILKVGPSEQPNARDSVRQTINIHPLPKRDPAHRSRPMYDNSYSRRGRSRGPPRNDRRRYYNNFGGNYRRTRNYRNYRNDYRQNQNQNPNFVPGYGQFLTNSRDSNNTALEDPIAKEFDFEGANQRFKEGAVVIEEKTIEEKPKEEVPADEESEKKDPESQKDEESEAPKENAEEKSEETKVEAKSKYNPELDFFDQLDGDNSKEPRQDVQKRRQVDAQTFGEIAQTYSPKVYRRSRRYRGRRRQNNYYRPRRW